MMNAFVQVCTSKERKTMQISRHWRLKAIRYRLEGVRVNSEQNQKQPIEVQREPRQLPTSVKPAATAAR
jgi:hypothetical protein